MHYDQQNAHITQYDELYKLVLCNQYRNGLI